MAKKKQSKKHKKRKKLYFKLVLYSLATLSALLLLMLSFIFMGIFGPLPGLDELKEINNYTASEVYSSDNHVLGRYYVENRTNTNFEEVPEFFVHALIATEDARFYSHQGVDTRSLLRVFVKSILLFDRSSGGGSTLSQQLAKNLYPRRRGGKLSLPAIKVREIIIARRIEKTHTKSEILQLYLNTVPFGDNTYGVETAALVFFNKVPAKLKPEESATLVGLLKGNSYYNPRTNVEAAKKRRNTVLNQMVRYEYLDEEEAEKLKKKEIVLNYRKIVHDEGPAPYFREHLRQELKRWADENPKPDGSKYNIYTDGLKIFTSINYNLQSYAEKAMAQHMQKLQANFDKHWKGKEPWKKNPQLARNDIVNSTAYKNLKNNNLSEEEIFEKLKQKSKTKVCTWRGEKVIEGSSLDSILHHFAMLQTGILSVESKTGFVKAWVGGINYKYFKYDHVKSRRQAGSTFKPIVYAAAVEKGIRPCDLYPNDSIVYTQYDNWIPRNADRTYGGFYSLKGALTNSVNTVSAQVLMETGTRDVVKLARKTGMEGNLPEVPSLALGSGTVSLYELVQAYSIFLNKGKKVSPVFILRIEDQHGNVIYTRESQIEKDQLISEKSAEEMLAMLKNVVDSGSASSLHSVYGLRNDIAGKTGTTQNQTDGWFVGLTPDLITAVWVGGDNPIVRFRSLTYGQGSYMALPIFARYMQKVYADPVYSASKNSRFNISEETIADLDCEEYREKEFDSIIEYLDKTEESIGSFIKRIFKRKDKKDKKRKKQNEQEEID